MKTPNPGSVRVAAFAALLPLSASCADNRLPPNPVPESGERTPVPGWFDPNIKWNPQGGNSRVYIEGKIVFDTARSTIRKESESVLEQLLKFLNERPDVTRLRVEGHTDSRASDDYNQGLSARRSLAVCDWLVDHGIDHLRLVAVGFGERKPIAPNELAAGMQENRRTEFHVMEVNGQPFGVGDTLKGGRVLEVLSAEERERLRNPPPAVVPTGKPFVPRGNYIDQVKPPPPKNDEDNPQKPTETKGE